MTKGAWLVVYGILLFICGVVAFLVNPAYPLLLIAGAMGGGLVVGLGIISLKKSPAWVPMVSTTLTLVLMMFGLALSMQYWLKVIKESARPTEALISTAIFGISGVVLWALKKKA